MIEEHAIVVGLEQETALLEVLRRTPCGLCGQTRGCGVSLWGRLFGHKPNIFRALNQIDSKVGDGVVVGIEEQALLTSALVIYGVPLLTMLIGALVAGSIFNNEVVSQVDRNTVVGAISGLAIGLLWVKGHTAGRGLSGHYRPVILRADDQRTIQLKCERSK